MKDVEKIIIVWKMNIQYNKLFDIGPKNRDELFEAIS